MSMTTEKTPHWYDETDEVVAFVRWFLADTTETWRLATDIFEKPWQYDKEYDAYIEGERL